MDVYILHNRHTLILKALKKHQFYNSTLKHHTQQMKIENYANEKVTLFTLAIHRIKLKKISPIQPCNAFKT